VRAELSALGRRFLEVALEPGAVSHARTAIAASAKFPEIGRAYFEAGPAYGAERIAQYLEAMTEAGVLDVKDPRRAAWQFLDLCKSSLHLRCIFAVGGPRSRQEIEDNVREAVDMFLHRYGR